MEKMRKRVYSLSLITLLLPCLASSVSSCPQDCHCLPELNKPDHIKISCKRSFISGRNEFLSFPANTTASLTVHCTDKTKYSNLEPYSFARFQNLRHLKLTKCSLKGARMSTGLFGGLDHLRTLQLEEISAKTPGKGFDIQSRIFAGLNKLEKLSFLGSQIRRFPSGTFCNLNELKLLNLSSNWISGFEDAGYALDDCRNQVVLLDLSRNRLSKIDKSDLDQLRSLHVLILANNQIRSIAENAFQYTERLQKLFLERNEITELRALPPNILQLDLSQNRLSIIPPALAQIQTLSKLNMSFNLLDSTTPFFLHGNRLDSLDLSANRFRILPARLFENTTSLTQLNLNDNQIESMENGTFRTLSKLFVLNLANNKLITLGNSQIEGLQNLTEFRLENNSISQLDDGFFGSLSRLRKLVLAKNLLLEVPTGLTRLYHLQELDLSENKIATIHKFLFDKLPNLEVTDLSKNMLQKIERYIFEDMAGLRVLKLSENGIESVESYSFDRNPILSEIYLQDNAIRKIENVFSSLQSLSLLNLTENRISFVDFSMFPVALETLLISNNQIAELTNMDNERSEIGLKTFDISFNKLTFLNGLLIPTSLSVGNFSHNRINSLAARTFYSKPNLQRVDLRNNAILLLNESALATAGDQYYEIFISANPLQCNCRMDWMKKQERGLIAGMPKVADYSELRCTQSHTGITKSLENFESSDLLCPYDVICADDCLCCDFDSCDCKNVCPDGCSCFRDSAFSTNIVQCSGTANRPGQKAPFVPMYATHIYLDDAYMPKITRDSFLGRFRSAQLYLNSSRVNYIQPRAFNGLTSLQLLDLSDNELTEIRGDEFYNTPKLLHLFLNGNRLRTLNGEAFARLPELRSITLHNNEFSFLPAVIPSKAPTLFAITLGNNPWRCDCNDRFLLQQWLPLHQTLVRDYESLYCFENLTLSDLDSTARNQTTVLAKWPATEGESVVKVNFWTFRKEMNRSFCIPIGDRIGGDSPLSPGATNLRLDIILALVIVGSSLLIVAAVVIVYKLRRRCLGFRHCKAPASLNSSGTTSTPVPLIAYDAFVSYNYAEEPMILNELVNQLENQPPYYQLCLLYRDLAASTFTTCHVVHDDMIRAMERSNTLLIILTSQFLLNEWEMVQIRTAHQCLLKDKQKKLIVVLVGDKTLLAELDPMLGHYLRTSTCLFWTDPLFWERLRDALPTTGCAQDTLTNSAIYSDLQYGTIVQSNFV